MTSDKQTPPLAKPFTPSLSASFHRSTKASLTPLTPKLASPGGYRTPKRFIPAEQYPSSAPSRQESDPAFLNANITPRSGSRVSRRDGGPSPGYTPSGRPFSPQPSLANSTASHGSSPGYRADRSPVRAAGRLEPARAGRAKTLTAEQSQQHSRPSSVSEHSSPRFFHASDARSTHPAEVEPRPRLPPKPASPATFIYANGQQERPSGEEQAAATLPVLKRRSISTGQSRSVVNAPPPCPSPRLRSPQLESNLRLSDSFVSQASSQEECDPVGPMQGPPLSHLVRPNPIRHLKSSSLDSGTSGTSPREGLRPSPIIVSPSDPRVDTDALASEPLPGGRPRILSNGSTASVDTHASPQSPQKSDSSGPNDAVGNARVGRKIMDLEISNSSLLAINRTLEREMRKQHAELRRYRRLSRSGRLSMVPSTRSVSGASLGVMTEVDEGSELSSVRSPDDYSESSDEESMPDEGVMSPGSLAEHDARHRPQDEKHFFVDLAKHQELLGDSQKMNQSLKRCLGWTEDLIKEGKRALEYSVHVNDVKLGGRVLSPEELYEVGEGAQGLLSPSNGAEPTISDTESFDDRDET